MWASLSGPFNVGLLVWAFLIISGLSEMGIPLQPVVCSSSIGPGLFYFYFLFYLFWALNTYWFLALLFSCGWYFWSLPPLFLMCIYCNRHRPSTVTSICFQCTTSPLYVPFPYVFQISLSFFFLASSSLFFRQGESLMCIQLQSLHITFIVISSL